MGTSLSPMEIEGTGGVSSPLSCTGRDCMAKMLLS
jgi:hypothetical protein